ncbi:MAG: T9SS type A sorting domain-containing protein, partial [Ignavibacteriaceae bacterium]
QNYPNPFNPTTKIRYEIPELNFVTIKIYDILGNEIVTLVNEEKPAGSYEIFYEASGLPSGVYFYSLRAGAFSDSKKMILLK